MINIGIYKAGYVDGNINKLCDILNSVDNYYHYKYVTQIQNLGNPDLSGYGYSDSLFSSIIQQHKNSYEISIILTSVPIEENFITRNIGYNIIIVTSHQMTEIIKESKLSIEECAAIGILEEVGSIEFQKQSNKHWRDLFHQDPRGCLFDFAGLKEQTIAKFKSLKLCSICDGKLNDNNVNAEIIRYLKGTLNKIKLPTLKKAWLKCIYTPLLNFIYGGIVIGLFVNILTSIIFNDSTLNTTQIIIIIVLITLIPILPLIVYLAMWIKIFQDKLKL